MSARILVGDCRTVLASLESESVQTCVTSPPYFGLRDYGVAGQIGLESTPDAYVAEMVAVFSAVRRVLKSDGTLWLNLGDSYAANRSYQVASTKGGAKHSPAQGALGGSVVPDGLKSKDLIGIPWRVAFALQADGWYLRSDIIWHKPNPMPESVTDRPTKAHEYVFLLSKSERYFYDADAIREPLVKGAAGSEFHTGKTGEHQLGRASAKPRKSGNKERVYGEDRGRPDSHLAGSVPWEDDGTGRNARTVWTIATQPYSGAHFATMPPALAERCVKAGSKRGDVVLDPFNGAGTTGLVADRLGRDYIGIELNPAYADLARKRIADDAPLFSEVA